MTEPESPQTEPRIFRNPFSDRWYFWSDAWDSTNGPYEDYVEAHAAFTAHMEAHKNDEAKGSGESGNEESQ